MTAKKNALVYWSPVLKVVVLMLTIEEVLLLLMLPSGATHPAGLISPVSSMGAFHSFWLPVSAV